MNLILYIEFTQSLRLTALPRRVKSRSQSQDKKARPRHYVTPAAKGKHGNHSQGIIPTPARRPAGRGQGKGVDLTPTEYKLLAAMAKAPNRAFTRDQLIDFVLDGEFDGYDRTIDTYIMTLRAKIEDDRRKPRHIVTVHGLGYKFASHEP
jgi:DNA-binding response OmpR family regulator